jgi:threonine dehydratase
MTVLPTTAAVERAAERLAPYIIPTPLVPSPQLSELLGRRVSLKLEFLQHTGSFKYRGALNRMLSLNDDDRRRGLVAVSGGNHGRAVAAVAGRFGIPATICMGRSAPPSAIAAIEAAGAEIRLCDDAAAAFRAAGELEQQGRTMIHPFADAAVVAGQGTLGREIVQQAPDVTDIFASIGGGGMIGGVALAVSEQRPRIRVWGAEPSGAAGLRAALRVGYSVALPQITSLIATLSPPSASDLTLALAQQYVHTIELIDDAVMTADTYRLRDLLHLQLEPAAACAWSLAQRVVEQLPADAHLVLILCGANMTAGELDQLAARLGLDVTALEGAA